MKARQDDAQRVGVRDRLLLQAVPHGALPACKSCLSDEELGPADVPSATAQRIEPPCGGEQQARSFCRVIECRVRLMA